eukprot:GHVS01037088.1.p1 GENE.GHVS01037088.1~~GHVS01037088.1.p1  ORF type:complete len:741 (-),score=172.34 GHVS01037088.1:466-2688(-)
MRSFSLDPDGNLPSYSSFAPPAAANSLTSSSSSSQSGPLPTVESSSRRATQPHGESAVSQREGGEVVPLLDKQQEPRQEQGGGGWERWGKKADGRRRGGLEFLPLDHLHGYPEGYAAPAAAHADAVDSRTFLPATTPISFNRLLATYSCRFFFALFVFLSSVFIQCIFTIWSDQFYHKGETRLRDRVHDALGGVPPRWVSVGLVNGCCTFLLFLSIFRFVVFVNWEMRFAIWTRWLWIVSVLYWIRSFCIIVTTLPCPVETCDPLRPSSFSEMVVYSLYEVVGGVYECTDLIISGHTLSTTSMMMLWVLYNRSPRWITWVVVTYGLWCLVLINISFFHYTIDIVMGVFYAVGAWSLYHLCLDIAVQRYIRSSCCNKQPLTLTPLLLSTDDNTTYCYDDRRVCSKRSDGSTSDSMHARRGSAVVVVEGGNSAEPQEMATDRLEETEEAVRPKRWKNLSRFVCCIDGVSHMNEKRGKVLSSTHHLSSSSPYHMSHHRSDVSFSSTIPIVGDWLIYAISCVEALPLRLAHATAMAGEAGRQHHRSMAGGGVHGPHEWGPVTVVQGRVFEEEEERRIRGALESRHQLKGCVKEEEEGGRNVVNSMDVYGQANGQDMCAVDAPQSAIIIEDAIRRATVVQQGQGSSSPFSSSSAGGGTSVGSASTTATPNLCSPRDGDETTTAPALPPSVEPTVMCLNEEKWLFEAVGGVGDFDLSLVKWIRQKCRRVSDVVLRSRRSSYRGSSA